MIRQFPPRSRRQDRAHNQRPYSALYYRNRTIVLANAVYCWRCGLPFTAEDPATAGHVVARAEGGSDELSNLCAEHQSCNARHGQQLGQELR